MFHGDYRVPRQILREEIHLRQKDDEHQVNDDGYPGRFAPPRAGQIVLQLNEQVGNMRGIVIQLAIRGFPSPGVVKAELLGLRLFRRRYRILEWNLG